MTLPTEREKGLMLVAIVDFMAGLTGMRPPAEREQIPHEMRPHVDRLMFEMWRIASESARPEALRIPDGWKLVPTKVTDAMLDGWFETKGGSDCGDVTEFQPRYAAMIAAAPSAPSPRGKQ